MFPYFHLFPSNQLSQSLSHVHSLSHSYGIRTKYFPSPIRVLAPCRARFSTHDLKSHWFSSPFQPKKKRNSHGPT